jgi:hypothetical protein
MRPARFRPLRLTLAVAAVVALVACGSDPVIPTGVQVAAIKLSVAPNPIATVATSGGTFVVRCVATVKESNGLGGTFEAVESRLYDDTTGVVIAGNLLDDKDLVVFVGSKRVEAGASLDIPVELSYVATGLRATSLTVRARVKDDRGNVLEQSLLVKAN